MRVVKSKWQVLYYETSEGVVPVEKFIDSRKDRDQAKIFSWISLLEEQGPNLLRPYADLLTDGIHELRVKLSGDQVRILYFFCYKDYIILTHAFRKQTTAVPHGEIKKAQICRADFLSRFSEKKIKEAKK
ncbi:MAG: type II toxin-antitoxin system RelE/ParE family toxin [Nitrospirae bacterium]|nr:type II toxin-antitoxin system RelE/ParE family toxin [Nitrospirota bacterium]